MTKNPTIAVLARKIIVTTLALTLVLSGCFTLVYIKLRVSPMYSCNIVCQEIITNEDGLLDDLVNSIKREYPDTDVLDRQIIVYPDNHRKVYVYLLLEQKVFKSYDIEALVRLAFSNHQLTIINLGSGDTVLPF